MAIHCDPAREETSRTCSARHDGLPRRSLAFPTRNDKVVFPTILSRTLSSRGLKARGDPP
ncbi:MAG: hypothetical protein HN553_07650 [Opitutae bacterium]|nr:hypothetical protein [Opitutae bacterium]